MALLDSLQGLGRAVAYHPGLAQMVGSVKAGLMLDQLLYWWPKRTDERGVYKTQAEWTEETGLSRKEQETARRQLSKLGIVETEYARLSHRLYFIVNENQLEELWKEHVHSRMPESDIGECTKRTVGNVQNGHSSSVHKSTAETTTEITRETPSTRESFDHPTHHVPCGKTRYENMVRDYGKKVVEEYIERVVNYCEAKGKTYKDYAAAAHNFMIRDKVKRKADFYDHELPGSRDYSYV